MFCLKSKLAIRLAALSIVALTFAACAENSPFKQMTSSILASTGVVSGDQVNSAFRVGEGLYKGFKGFNEEEEYYLGRSVAAMVLSKYRPDTNPGINKYISRVGLTLARASTRPETFGGYHFQLLDSSEINAMATPGGFVFITRGLLNILPDEDALAAVLAHEVGHVVAGDGVKAISQANLTQAGTLLGKEALGEVAARNQLGGEMAAATQLTEAFGGSVNDIFNTLITSGYSRSQEYAADGYAAELMKKVGYNPAALIVVMNKLEQAHAKGGLLETHPAPEDRKEELDDLKLADLKATAGEAIRASRFQKSVRR